MYNGKRSYLVKWKGENWTNSWEPEGNVAPALKEHFHAHYTYYGGKTQNARAENREIKFVSLCAILNANPRARIFTFYFIIMFSNIDFIKILLYTRTGYDAVRVTILWNRACTFFDYHDLLCARKIQSLPSG